MSKTFETADDLIRDLLRDHTKAQLVEMFLIANARDDTDVRCDCAVIKRPHILRDHWVPED